MNIKVELIRCDACDGCPCLIKKEYILAGFWCTLYKEVMRYDRIERITLRLQKCIEENGE